MTVETAAVVRSCEFCAHRRVRLRKRFQRLKLLSAAQSLEEVTIDTSSALPSTQSEKQLLLVISDRFAEVTEILALANTIAHIITVLFCENFMPKHGVPRPVLSESGLQFAFRVFKLLECTLLDFTSVDRSVHHSQREVQVEK